MPPVTAAGLEAPLAAADGFLVLPVATSGLEAPLPPLLVPLCFRPLLPVLGRTLPPPVVPWCFLPPFSVGPRWRCVFDQNVCAGRGSTRFFAFGNVLLLEVPVNRAVARFLATRRVFSSSGFLRLLIQFSLTAPTILYLCTDQ